MNLLTRGSRVLFLSHSHAFGPFRVGSHHYARSFAQAGADVVHLSTPISVAHRVTGRVASETIDSLPREDFRDHDGVHHLVPRTVLPVPYGRFRVGRELARRGLGDNFDAVYIDQPLLWHDSLRQISPRLIYRPTDLYPAGLKHTMQERILRVVDGVVATSSVVRSGLGEISVPSLVIENGVDASRFLLPESRRRSRSMTCIYVGALDARFDWIQLNNWALLHPDVRFLVAGPGAAAPHNLPNNVKLMGAVPYEALPELLHSARIGLLPLSEDPLNAGRSPMKLYEYLASGLSVVTRESPVLRADERSGIYTYVDAGDADRALTRALAHVSPNERGAERAREQSWVAKAATMATFTGTLFSG